MLKFEGYSVGETIRGLDFRPMEGRDSIYVEGEIVDIIESGHADYRGYKAYKIIVSVDSAVLVDDKYSRVGLDIFIPMESNFDYDERVKLVA